MQRFDENSKEHDNQLNVIGAFLKAWYSTPVAKFGIEHLVPNDAQREVFRDNTRQDLVFWHLKTSPDLCVLSKPVHMFDFKIDNHLSSITLNAMQFMLHFLHRTSEDLFTYIVYIKQRDEFCIFDLNVDILKAVESVNWVEFTQPIWFYEQYQNLIGANSIWKLPIRAHRESNKGKNDDQVPPSNQDYVLLDIRAIRDTEFNNKKYRSMEKALAKFYSSVVSVP